jgi:hypothetical protein
MSQVVEFVEDTVDFVGDVFESVGDVIEDVADVAFDIVEDVGGFVGDVVESALDNPLQTIAQVAAVATGNAWALPLINAGAVVVQGGSLEDAALAGGLTYLAQGVTNYVAGQIGGGAASNLVDTGVIDYDYGSFSNPYDYGIGAGGWNIPESFTQIFDDGSTLITDSAGNVLGYTPATDFFGAVAPVTPDVATPPPTVQVFDDGSSIQTFDDGSTLVTDSGGNVTATPIPEIPVVVEPPYDPYADEGPSQPSTNVVGTDDSIPDMGEVEIVGERPVTPVSPDSSFPTVQVFDDGSSIQTFDDGSTLVIDSDGNVTSTPATDLPITPPADDLGEIEIVDTRPPADDLGEIVITDTRPPADDLGEIVITDTRPVAPPEDDLGEIIITDTRPVTPIDPDLPAIEQPDVVDPVVTPPIDLTPYVPIVVVPPYTPPTPPTTPPYTPPVFPELPPRTYGSGLNPGFIQPGAFYNTTNPNQSKFFWGGHGYQAGPDFDQRQYNQVAAPVNPWGLQGQAQPLTGEQISNVIAGQPLVQAPVAPATRVEQYRPNYNRPPSYGQIKLSPQYGGSAATPAATAMSAAPEMSTAAFTAGPATGNMDQVTAQLGPNWFNRQQASAAAGDWDSYYQIQQQVDNIMYQPLVKGGKFESTK